MANIYSYSQIPIFIDNQYLLATDARLSVNNNLEPSYVFGSDSPVDFQARDAVNTTFSFSYYPMFHDIVYNAMLNNSGITIDFGNIILTSGYISNFSFQVRAGNPIQSQAEVTFFKSPERFFRPETITRRRVYLNKPGSVKSTDLPHADSSDITQTLVTIPIGFNYQYQTDLLPVYRIGEFVPSEMRIIQRQITCNLEGDNLSKFAIITGEDAVISFAPKNLWSEDFFRTEREKQVEFGAPEPQVYTCSGKIVSFNLDATNNNFLKGNISVIQYL